MTARLNTRPDQQHGGFGQLAIAVIWVAVAADAALARGREGSSGWPDALILTGATTDRAGVASSIPRRRRARIAESSHELELSEEDGMKRCASSRNAGVVGIIVEKET